MSKLVHIMFVNGTSEIGGADVDLLEICRHLDKSRFCLTVVLPKAGPLSDDFLATGAQLIYIDPAPIKRFRQPIEWISYPWRFFLAIVNLWGLIRRIKPAIVHINSAVLPSAAFAARLARVPCLWHIREIELLQRSRIVGAFLLGCIQTFPDRIVTISISVATSLNLASNPKVCTVYHGVDTDRFFPTDDNYEIRAKMGIPEFARVIGYVGRLAPIKGLEYLIEAFGNIHQQFSESYLLLTGPVLSYHEYFNSLSEQVNRLGLSKYVRFILDGPDISVIMRALDVLVLPTIVPEGLGIVILEGLSSGIPVIATNQGGPEEILNGCDAGWLVPPKDSQSITDAVFSLLKLSSCPTGKRTFSRTERLIIARA